MIEALLLIFVGYLLYKAFMFKRRIDAMRKDFRRQFEEAQRHFGGSQNPFGDTQYSGEQTGAPQPREKRYAQTDGEYVEFEELPTPTEPESPTDPTNNTPNTNPTSSYPQEDLITDAEYEEIPN